MYHILLINSFKQKTIDLFKYIFITPFHGMSSNYYETLKKLNLSKLFLKSINNNKLKYNIFIKSKNYLKILY